MGVGVGVGVGTAVIAWLFALCVYDVRQRRLPNALTLPGAAAVLVFAFVMGRGLPAVVGGLALAGLYLVVHFSAPASMGPGDVKLALGVGALTGYCGVAVWALAALAAPLLTATWAVVSVLRRVHRTAGISLRSIGAGPPIPHGPSMCVATVAAIALALV